MTEFNLELKDKNEKSKLRFFKESLTLKWIYFQNNGSTTLKNQFLRKNFE